MEFSDVLNLLFFSISFLFGHLTVLSRRKERSLSKGRIYDLSGDLVEFCEDKAITDHLNKVGQRITTAAGYKDGEIIIHGYTDEGIQAFCSYQNFVFVSKAMFEDFRSDDEMAFVLAHEVSHIKFLCNSDIVPDCLEGRRNEEYRADQAAVRLMKSAGYDPNEGAQLLWKWMGYLYQSGTDIHNDKESRHPTFTKRIAAINNSILDAECFS